jgi:hypothetical protein
LAVEWPWLFFSSSAAFDFEQVESTNDLTTLDVVLRNGARNHHIFSTVRASSDIRL